MLKDAGDSLVVGRGRAGLVLLIGVQTPAPVKGCRNLFTPGVEGDLLVEQHRRRGVISQTVVQPRRLPMAAGRIAVGGKTRGQVTVVGNGLGIILTQQVHIGRSVERFGQPWALGKALLHLRNQRLHLAITYYSDLATRFPTHRYAP